MTENGQMVVPAPEEARAQLAQSFDDDTLVPALQEVISQFESVSKGSGFSTRTAMERAAFERDDLDLGFRCLVSAAITELKE